ncbi:PAS domain-containing protein [Halarcobacter sp.]|uniref:PAS domain-containing protein n=1 Tax=Halarcobacter sp. TaxID=2321133 RepID=UPI0029F48E61|nr:PAS domain-containing protein [Halarcobacter sp.]
MKTIPINENNIGKINLIVSLLLVLLFVMAIIYSAIYFKKESYSRLKTELQEKYIDNKIKDIRVHVQIVNELLMSKIEGINLTKEEKQKYVIKYYEQLNKKNPKEYFFVFELVKQEDNNYLEKVIVHPNVPKGKILDSDRIDLHGNKFVKNYQELAIKNGYVFFDYSFIHPEEKKEMLKKGFAILNKWNWIVGSGFFISDVEDELSLIDEKIKENIYIELKGYIEITIFFLIFLIFFILKMNKFTTKTVNKFKEQVEKEKLKLIESKEYLKQYTTILENCTIVSKYNKNEEFIYVSEGFCETLGYQKNELLGKPYNTIKYIDEIDESESVKEKFIELLENKKSIKRIIKNRSKEGKILSFIVIATPILDKNDEIVEFVSYRIDITKEEELKLILKKQNKELLKSQKILNEAQRIAHIGNWEHNYISDKISFSQEAKRIIGYDENIEEVDFSEFSKIIHEDDRVKLKENKNLALNKDSQFNFEYRILREDGKIVYVEVKGEYVYDEKNNLIKSLGTINDITERIEAEKELKQKDLMLLQQSKMAAMGEMLSNIAHQWRQPLSLISTAATGAKIQREIGSLTDEKLDETFTTINNTTQYLSKTIDDFRNFFKPNSEKNYFNISDVMYKAISLVKPQFKNRNIDIIKNIEDYKLYGLENEFLQVIINILNNSRDQLMKIENEKLILISSYKKADKYILEIKDNGKGIEEKIIAKVFEPYFTTKYNSEGTGIGLYMCEEIVVKHMNGQISAENTTFTYNNKKYFGAKFTITLPLTKE